MSIRPLAKLNMVVLFIAILSSAYGYGCSSPSTSGGQVSSASAQLVTCPTTTSESVAISNSAFSPNSVTITVNDIVKWTNNDSITHTVTSGAPGATDGKFDSGNLAAGSTVCVQFLIAGTFNYFCNIHTFMTGNVIVQ
jgi:plastocyanin